MDEMTKQDDRQGVTRSMIVRRAASRGPLMEHRRYALSRGSPLSARSSTRGSRRSKAKLLAPIGGSEMDTDPQRKRHKEFSQFLLWRDYGWTPAWRHFSPAVLQGLWSAAEDPAAPWLEFRMRDGRSVFLCKFAAFLPSGTASDAALPCGLQWLTRNPGQQDAPILDGAST